MKSYGKVVSYVRLSQQEKRELAEMVHEYKRQGIHTSENEINRIAVNFMIEDYQANGKGSLLARVLEALSA